MTNSVTAMRVGVCYKDKAWAVEQIKRMTSLINPDAIERQRDLCVELKDGSYIKGIPCSDSARGYKFNKIYSIWTRVQLFLIRLNTQFMI